MAGPPAPAEIFQRSAREGERRLEQSTLELVATSFIAGFTVVFGIVALGVVHAAVPPRFGDLSSVAGALAFGTGLVFLVVGRAELFNENFFDPVAAALVGPAPWPVGPVFRLWALTYVFNLVGGLLLVALLSVEHALPPGAAAALVEVSARAVRETAAAQFAKAVAGGTLVSLMSYLLSAVESDGGRILVAYVVGVVLALGPFEHVVVTMLHVAFGVFFGAGIDIGAVGTTAGLVTAGNLVGGLGLTTMSHAAQALGAREAGG